MEVLMTGLGNNNEGTTHNRDDKQWVTTNGRNDKWQGTTNRGEQRTAGNDELWGTMNHGERRTAGMMNGGDDEPRGMAAMTNGGDRTTACLTLATSARWWGIFLFSLPSPMYAAASTCSQGVYALILFNIFN
jgi:hypothetical protein